MAIVQIGPDGVSYERSFSRRTGARALVFGLVILLASCAGHRDKGVDEALVSVGVDAPAALPGLDRGEPRDKPLTRDAAERPENPSSGPGPNALANLDASALRAAFAQRGPGWAGGDLMEVVDLPDERRLWIFADTFYGHVEESGAVAQGHHMVHSSAVLQEGGSFQVIETDDGWGWVSSPPDGTWLWPQEAMTDENYLYVFMVKVEHRADAAAGLDFRALGGSLAVFDLDDLSHPMMVLPDVPSIQQHAFGWGVVTYLDHHYLYAHGEGANTFVARAPQGKLPNFHLWTYWDGAGWGTDPELSASVHPLHLRIAERDGQLSAAALPFLETTVQLFSAQSPVGPFVAVGSASLDAVEPDEPSWGYSPLIAPGPNGRPVLLVNFLPWNMGAITRDIQVLGPRFLDLDPNVFGS